ncbi:MAG TPA: hypothetical protein VGP55_12140 [Chitinophagaceae bacterium]|nr:hypothetical protein [Chitinophagaceae bacterium]
MNANLAFTISLLAITFTSCTTNRYIYSASPANNPYFTKKGDSKLTGYYSSDAGSDATEKYARGLDLQGGYAFGNHWAIIAGYFNRKERDVQNESSRDDFFINYKRDLSDIGGGYFTQFNGNKNLSFNFYGGFASGKFSFEEDNYTRYHESVIHKWFLQPSINFIEGEYFRGSIATKVSFVHYGNVKTSYTSTELNYYGLDKIADNTIIFFEPSFNIQFGISQIPWVKADLVFSGSSDYQRPNSRLDVRSSNVSIGLSFDFSKINKKSKGDIK